MRFLKQLGVAALVVVSVSPAFAASELKKGEAWYVKSDGTTGTMMVTDEAKAKTLMSASTAVNHCVVVMRGADGKFYVSPDMMGASGAMSGDSAGTGPTPNDTTSSTTTGTGNGGPGAPGNNSGTKADNAGSSMMTCDSLK